MTQIKFGFTRYLTYQLIEKSCTKTVKTFPSIEALLKFTKIKNLQFQISKSKTDSQCFDAKLCTELDLHVNDS